MNESVTQGRVLCLRRPALPAVFAAAAVAFLLLAPAGRSASNAVIWNPPTRADQFRLAVSTGAHVSLALKASTSLQGASVHIVPVRGLPQGAEVSSSAGTVARATFRWTPALAGDYRIHFVASSGHGASAPMRTYTIHVNGHATTLTDATIGHWAVVLQPAVVRSQPNQTAAAVTRLDLQTSDQTQNIVLALAEIDLSPTERWYKIRLPILPNNSTGWVRSTALGPLYTVHTHLYVDRSKLQATLKRDGHTIFTAIVGVGKPYWPTPHGEFYIRDKLTDFGGGFYGPLAYGTSARSAILTDWPGGGFVGIHGTSLPQLLPGRVSHGCIRMRNQDILKLSHLMQVGTPLTIR